MASPRNRHCANCVGTLSFPIVSFVFSDRLQRLTVIGYFMSFTVVVSPPVRASRKWAYKMLVFLF